MVIVAAFIFAVIIFLATGRATASVAAPLKTMPDSQKPSAFKAKFLAESASVQWHGIPIRFALAVADVETGGGTNNLSRKANNIFSIKVGSGWREGWDGEQTYTTADGGVFRSYKSWAESMADFVHLLHFSRYENALAYALVGNFPAFAAELKKAGYDASNPKYADALVSRYRQYENVEVA